MYIPELTYTFYAPIVLVSILIGLAVACYLMRLSGASKQTVMYTALLTFVMIIAVAFMTSVVLSGNIRKAGFAAAGGALGLASGVVISALIHRDHTAESVASWIVAAPLMYGLSKIACHIAGCCNGIPYDGALCVRYGAKSGAAYFPVQLLETVVFLLIFAAGLFMYLKTSRKLRVACIVITVSCIAKVLLEFLRESHMGKVISGYQILVMVITAVFLIVFVRMDKGRSEA